MRVVLTFFFTHLLLFNSCNSLMKNSEGINNDEDSFSEWGPLEINKTSTYITDKLSEYLKNNTSKPFLEFLKIENKSSEHIDSSLLENEIKSKLIKNKITFIDKSKRKDTLKEIELDMRGIVDEKSKIRAGYLLSPSYQLKGDINDVVRYINGEKKQLLIINFTLLNIETNAIDWQESKRFSKNINTSRIGF
jgi:predicted nuclease with TOPRIM domain